MKKLIIKLAILSVLIILVIIYLSSKENINLPDMLCEDCLSEMDCNDFCVKTCLKKLYDRSGYDGYENESQIFCNCKCESTIRSLLG